MSGSGCNTPGRLGVVGNRDPYSDTARPRATLPVVREFARGQRWEWAYSDLREAMSIEKRYFTSAFNSLS
jgi:hypothetical protein